MLIQKNYSKTFLKIILISKTFLKIINLKTLNINLHKHKKYTNHKKLFNNTTQIQQTYS